MDSKRFLILLLAVLVVVAVICEAAQDDQWSFGSKTPKKKSMKKLAQLGGSLFKSMPDFDLFEIVGLINDVTRGFQAWIKLHAILLQFFKPMLGILKNVASKDIPELSSSSS